MRTIDTVLPATQRSLVDDRLDVTYLGRYPTPKLVDFGFKLPFWYACLRCRGCESRRMNKYYAHLTPSWSLGLSANGRE
jgi:hypothetical protein